MLVTDPLAGRADPPLDAVHRLLTDDLPGYLGAACRDDLLDRFDRVWDQAAGPGLRLAVLGEFSSGKSTLINAFLRDAVLPASARESTVVRTDIVPGRRFSVRLRLERRGRWLDAEQDRAHWHSRLPELAGSDARALVAALSAGTVSVDRVHALRVTHPSRGPPRRRHRPGRGARRRPHRPDDALRPARRRPPGGHL